MVCTCSFSTLFLQLASLLGQFQQLHRWGVGAGEGGCTSEAVESGQEGKWTELGHHNNVLTLIWSNVDSSRVVMPQVLTIFFPFFWQLVGRNDSRGVTWQTKKSVRKIFLDTIFWEETFVSYFLWSEPELWPGSTHWSDQHLTSLSLSLNLGSILHIALTNSGLIKGLPSPGLLFTSSDSLVSLS